MQNELTNTQIFDFFSHLIFSIFYYSSITVFIIIALYYFYVFFYKDGYIDELGLRYSIGSGSSANPPSKKLKDGHIWTSLNNLRFYSLKNQKKESRIFINQFRYFDDYAKKIKIPNWLRKIHESLEVFIDASMMARGMLIVGSAGGGKTVAINSISAQKWYRKGVFFSKKGDSEKLFYRPKIDFLINPKIKSGTVHDILSEDIQYIEVYINTLMNATLGKSQDYFSGNAKQKLKKFLEKVKIKEYDDNLTVIEKWDLFLNFFAEAFEDAQNGDQKSERDVLSTVSATMENLYLTAYRIKQGHRTFTAKEFFSDTKKRNNVFLNATDPSMIGLLSATAAVLITYQLAMPDIKEWDEDFKVYYNLDEYLSFAAAMDDEILAEISRVGRSKGICAVKSVQSFPSKEDELKELVSNVQYIMIFASTDDKVYEKLNKIIGKTEYVNRTKNESYSGNKKTISYSDKLESRDIVSQYQVNTIQNEGFSHIFFAPKEKILYKGYTPEIHIKERKHINFNEIPLVGFYKWKHEFEDDMKDKAKKNKAIAQKILGM